MYTLYTIVQCHVYPLYREGGHRYLIPGIPYTRYTLYPLYLEGGHLIHCGTTRRRNTLVDLTLYWVTGLRGYRVTGLYGYGAVGYSVKELYGYRVVGLWCYMVMSYEIVGF